MKAKITNPIVKAVMISKPPKVKITTPTVKGVAIELAGAFCALEFDSSFDII